MSLMTLSESHYISNDDARFITTSFPPGSGAPLNATVLLDSVEDVYMLMNLMRVYPCQYHASSGAHPALPLGE